MCDECVDESVIDGQSENDEQKDEKDGEMKIDDAVVHDGIKKRKRLCDNDEEDDDKKVERKKFKDYNDGMNENVEEGKGNYVEAISTITDNDIVNTKDDKESVKVNDQKLEDKKNIKNKKKKKKNEKINVSSDNYDNEKTTNQNVGKNIQAPKAQLRVISK